MILCIGKTPEQYALAKKLTGEKDDEKARHLLNELFPFVIDEWLGRRNRPYNVNNLTGDFIDNFLANNADTVEVQQIVQEKLKYYKHLDDVDFPLVQKIIAEQFVKPEHFARLLKHFNLTDHQLETETNRYKDFKFQLIEKMYKGTLSQEDAAKLGYINHNKQVSKFDTNTAEFYSGAADGADKEWAKQARALGIKVKDYTIQSYKDLSQEWKDRIEQEYTEARAFLGKPKLTGYSGELTRRDMMQADKADAIFAIAERIVKPGEKEISNGKEYTNNTNHDNVAGGTANAVARGIIKGIPVYVFDQSDNQWKVWDNNTGTFIPTQEPTLTPHAATIGTRDINEAGKNTISNILQKTLQNLILPSEKTNLTESKNQISKTNDLPASTEGIATFDLGITQEEYEAAAKKKAAETRTSIVYNVETTGTPLNIQLDDIKFKLSVQDKRAALDIIADSFYNIINTALTKSNEKILKDAKERGIEPAKLRVQIERQNKEILNSLNIEGNFKNPDKKFVRELQSKVIPLTELDVVKAFGAENIINIIRTQLQNNPRTKLIADNFDALLRQAASKINNIYGINILGNTELFDDDDEGEENSNDQSNTEHNSEGSKEDFTHADDKTRASERSLTKDLKLAYRQCFVTNDRGQVVTNSYGYKVPIDISAAHNKVLHLLEGMIDVTDVLPMLQKSQEGWVKQFIIKLQKNPKLLNQLYYCTKLSAQDYRIVYYKDGQLIQQSINRLSEEELLANETTSNIVNGLLQTSKKNSIYTTDGKVNQEGIDNSKTLLNEIIKDVVRATDLNNIPNLDERLSQIFKSLGITIPATYNLYESIALFNTENPKAGLQKILDNIKNFYENVGKNKEGVINTSDNYLTSVFKFIGKSDVGYIESSVTENGKSYYTYSKTNYIDELLLHVKQSVKGKKLANGNDYYKSWQQEQFGQSAFFKNPKTEEWYSDWMRKLFGNGSRFNKYRNLIERCSVLYTKGKDGKKVEFTKWSDVDSMTTNYAMYKQANPRLEDKLEANEAPTWYRMPIASDSNASDYIQFIRYITDSKKTYDQILDDKFWEICKQELVRIADVTDHLNQKLNGENTSADIKGYDAKLGKDGLIDDAGGMVFTLLPQMNYVKINPNNHKIFNKIQSQYLDRFNGVSFLNAIKTLSSIRNNKDITIETITEEDLKDFFLEAFHAVAEQDFNNEFEQVKEVFGESEKANYREYYYNYMYAWIQMVELTSTDTAFFGKRKVKEVNDAKNADFTHTRYINENGIRKAIKHHYKIVSDDTLSTFQKRNKEYHAPTNKLALRKPYFKEVYLNDIEIESEILKNELHIVESNKILDNKAKARLTKILKKKVNVADGQSYRSLQSYKELLEAKGVLTDEQRSSFDRIIYQHTWDEGDLNIIALAIKPYCYAVLPHTRSTNDVTGNKNVVMSPTQHKNSELPLAAALGAISASLNKSTTLQALDEFMFKHNIDVVHFNSVVKVGETGTIEVDYESKSVEEVVDKLEKQCGFDTSINGNPEVVHEIPTSAWGEQLSKPEHLLDAKQLVGSQIRRLILADLPNDPDYRINIPRFIDGKLTFEPMTVNDFKSHYQELITASLLEDFSAVDEIFKDPHQLEAFLQESIASSTKYDEDLLEMFTWDDVNKRFKIPFWNRTVSNRVEEILLALMKNRIGKQKIAGGAAVQTAAVGLSKELNVRYQKNGEILDTFNEYITKNPNKTADDYDKYIDGATLAYMEVYLPMWSKDMIEILTDDNGTLHYERLPEELKYMVGYRIPTEDHYSCAPLYVKGFLPNLNASTIVVPADISTIAGSDYDIDVMYLMRHEFNINKYNEDKLKTDYQKAKDKYDTKNEDVATDKLLSEIFGVDTKELKPKFVNYQRWRNKHIWDIDEKGNRKYLLPKDKWTIEKIQYDTTKTPEENNRKARNNEFIDTIIGCLQSPHSLDKFTNVGNYDELKIASRICEIITHPSNTSSMQTLMSKSLDELNDIVAELNKNKNLASPQTQTDLHQQNMAGNQLKGIFVAAKSLQEVLQHTPMEVIHRFTINGNESIKDDFRVGKLRASDGTLITKRFASYVAAAVDNGKDPLMNALKINPKNANVVNYLTLLGYTPLEIGLFLNCATIDISKRKLSEEDKVAILDKYSNIYEYSALKLDMMSWAAANKDNLEDERVIAMALIAKDTFDTIKQQAQTLMILAKGLRADSMNFRKSMPENLQLIFAIDNFLKANTRFNYETGSKEYTVFKPLTKEQLPIIGAFIGSRDYDDDPMNEGFSFEAVIKNHNKFAALPYLQCFADTLFSASTYWMDPYTLYTKGRMLDICEALNKAAGQEAPKIIADFIDAYQRQSTLRILDFLVSDNPELNTTSKRREYLVKDFPQEFAKWKQHLPEELKGNLFIDNIILVQPNRYDKNFHLEVKELGKNKDIRAKFKADCDRLAAVNETMARKLFAYTTFRNGFGYSQTGWAHLTSVNFQESLPNYIEDVEGMHDINKEVIQDLFVQFLCNNYEKYKDIYTEVSIEGEITFDGNVDGSGAIVFVNFGGIRAVSFDGGNTYIRITPTLGANGFYHEYFKREESQVSIFDKSDRAVEVDKDSISEDGLSAADLAELEGNVGISVQVDNTKQNSTSRQQVDQKNNGLDATGIQGC